MDRKRRQSDSVWIIDKSDLKFHDPPEIAGRGTFGLVVKAEYRGTTVAVKRVIPPKDKPFRGSFLDAFPDAEESSESAEWKNEASGRTVRITTGSTTTGSTMSGGTMTNATGTPPMKMKRRITLDSIFDDKELEIGVNPIDLEAGRENKNYTTKRRPSTQHSVLSSVDTAVTLKKAGTASRSGTAGPSSKSIWGGFFGYKATEKTYEQLKQDFIVEMRLLSKLRHPCITTVCSFHFRVPPFPYKLSSPGALYTHRPFIILFGGA
jgi:hypothetical protein